MTRIVNYSMCRGVSSTVKLPVSKTGLGGSNPSAPARFLEGRLKGPTQYGSGDEEDGKLDHSRRRLRRPAESLAGTGEVVLQRRAHRNAQSDGALVERGASHNRGGRDHGIYFWRLFFCYR